VAGVDGGVEVRRALFLTLAVLIFPLAAQAQLPGDSVGVDSADFHFPPTEVETADHPSDGGGAIDIKWRAPADSAWITGYEILRSTEPAGDFVSVGLTPANERQFTDATTEDGVTYFYKVAATGMEASAVSDISPPVESSEQWFNAARLNQFIIGLLISAAIIFFIAAAKAGRELFVRKIAGLDAVDEAIGRATEMGRPILFIPGIQDMDDVQTIAGLTILSRIAKTSAEYDTKLNIPVSRSLVMTTARETIRESFSAAGRPDAYYDDIVHYVTDEQFGYVAAVDGIMVRERPATCFYLGSFFAESLIMAETGNEIGAIQIAGTAQPAQLPFFVAACDYTLIGEELFAASAYLSGEPRQLGSLKGQDLGKGLAMAAIVIGTILWTLSSLMSDSPGIRDLARVVSSFFQVN